MSENALLEAIRALTLKQDNLDKKLTQLDSLSQDIVDIKSMLGTRPPASPSFRVLDMGSNC